MIIEKVKGYMVTSGEVTSVTSEYTLGKGDEFVKLLGGAEGSLRGDTLRVTTKYDDSLSFAIVVENDGKRTSSRFKHIRKVVRPVNLNINHCPQSVRLPVADLHVDVPSLVEVNVDAPVLERVGF